MKKQNKDWGKFESMYRGLYPDLSEEDRNVLNQYPEHREFIFEQFMKTEENSVPSDMKIKLMGQVADESNRVFLHVMLGISVIIMFLVFVFSGMR